MQRCEFATAVAIRNYGNKLELFDMDFNATHADLKTHLKSIVQDSSRLNVGQMLVPGCSLKDSLEAVQLAKSFPNVLFTTAGVHPYNVLERACDDIAKKELRELVNSENVSAIGECGLDFSDGFPGREQQIVWFREQLKIALEFPKPLFLHERMAHAVFIEMMDEFMASYKVKYPCQPLIPMLVHCFTGNARELQNYVERDCMIGVTGHICKPNAGKELREIVSRIPQHKLVIETDAPYMGFPKCQSLSNVDKLKHKKRQYPNVPMALPLVVEQLALLRNETIQELAQATTLNARQFLRLSD